MSRYVTRRHLRPRALGEWENDPLIPSLSVDGPYEVDRGILDARGEKLFRVQPPIGFGRDDEW